MNIQFTKTFFYASSETYRPQLPMKCRFIDALTPAPPMREAALIEAEHSLFGSHSERLVLVPRYPDQSVYDVPPDGIVVVNLFLATKTVDESRFSYKRSENYPAFVDVGTIAELRSTAEKYSVKDPASYPPVPVLDINSLTQEEIIRTGHDPLALKRLVEKKNKEDKRKRKR